MPPVPGLLSVVSLLFAPYVEMRTDAVRSRYTGSLCGLGPDMYGDAIYPDHDMEIQFDVEINDEDLGAINWLRYKISQVLNGRDRVRFMKHTNSKIEESLRNRLLELILRERKAVEPHSYKRPNKWNQVPETLICPAVTVDREEEATHILPLHSGILLKSDGMPSGGSATTNQADMETPAERRKRLTDHLIQLRKKASRSVTAEHIVCQLCDKVLDRPRTLMIHLHTNEHKKREAELID